MMMDESSIQSITHYWTKSMRLPQISGTFPWSVVGYSEDSRHSSSFPHCCDSDASTKDYCWKGSESLSSDWPLHCPGLGDGWARRRDYVVAVSSAVHSLQSCSELGLGPWLGNCSLDSQWIPGNGVKWKLARNYCSSTMSDCVSSLYQRIRKSSYRLKPSLPPPSRRPPSIHTYCCELLLDSKRYRAGEFCVFSDMELPSKWKPLSRDLPLMLQFPLPVPPPFPFTGFEAGWTCWTGCD